MAGESDKVYGNLFIVLGFCALLMVVPLQIFDDGADSFVSTLICIVIGLFTLLWGVLIWKGRL